MGNRLYGGIGIDAYRERQRQADLDLYNKRQELEKQRRELDVQNDKKNKPPKHVELREKISRDLADLSAFGSNDGSYQLVSCMRRCLKDILEASDYLYEQLFDNTTTKHDN